MAKQCSMCSVEMWGGVGKSDALNESWLNGMCRGCYGNFLRVPGQLEETKRLLKKYIPEDRIDERAANIAQACQDKYGDRDFQEVAKDFLRVFMLGDGILVSIGVALERIWRP